MARPVVIVTGGGTGLGAATCIGFARRGYDVCVGYRSSVEQAQAVAEACMEAGGNAMTHRVDVVQDDECRATAAAVSARWGRIDGLVNNAGTTVFVQQADLEGLSAADFETLNRVNVVGAFQMARAVSAPLRATSGAIVNVSSITGITGRGTSMAYATSKAALNMLTITLARALAPVRVNAIAPGMIETEWMRRGASEAGHDRARQAVERTAALGRICTPEEVADAISWLMEAPTVTGEVLPIDAGMMLGR